MTNPTLQAELEQVIQDIIALGTDHSNNLPAPQNESDALQAILATVSKHLPEKAVPDADVIGCPECGGWQAYNAAITEMKKTLGGNYE